MTTMTLVATPDPEPNEDSLTITIKRSDLYNLERWDKLVATLGAAWADKDGIVIQYGVNERFLTDFNLQLNGD